MNALRLFKVGVLFVLVFTAGGVTGALLHRHVARRALRDGGTGPSYQTTRQMLTGIDNVLKLTPEQREKVAVLLDDFDRERAAHPEWTRIDRWRSFLRHAVQIRVLLTPEQAATFDQAIETMRPRRVQQP